jgi:hypothetical protein
VDTRALAKNLALGRVLFGAALLLQPERAVRGWIGGRAASYGGTQAVTQALGARDLSLGAGALAALTSGSDARDWVLAGAFADVADLTATLTSDELPLSGRIIVTLLAGNAIVISAAYLAARDQS